MNKPKDFFIEIVCIIIGAGMIGFMLCGAYTGWDQKGNPIKMGLEECNEKDGEWVISFDNEDSTVTATCSFITNSSWTYKIK